ncbi:MAG: aspartate aminotransferase family protein [Chitinispirillales bacterium]|jgi:predicted acetylornithine/succinylornithine family transaminase|nr:aspartate aminotransferase family protein [Chitinispirillales bacterium]
MNYEDFYVPTYARTGAPVDYGKDVYLFDINGKKYIDCAAGIAVNALGYGNKALEETIEKQAKKIIHSSNLYFSQPNIDLAKTLIENSFADKVFFCNSGTEANEAAIKFSRKYASAKKASKTAILSFYGSFHGRTYASMTATGQKCFHEGYHPLPQGFFYAPFNNIEATKNVLENAEFAAIIVEPIQAEGGVCEAAKEFLQFLREVCDKNDIALIFDEIQCGIGRSGKLWAYQNYDIIPDMLTAAKPLGGGIPLGAVLANEKFVSTIKAGDHGTTFGGNCVACALGNTVFSIIDNREFLDGVVQKGEYLKQKLSEIQKTHDEITGIFGRGLLVGVQLNFESKKAVTKAKEKGLLLAKSERNMIRFIPPLIISKDELDEALKIFVSVLDEVKN